MQQVGYAEYSWLCNCADLLFLVKPFSRDAALKSQKARETEADEDNMESRLQLDLGMLRTCRYFNHLLCLERGSLTRQSARSGQKGDADDNFRGVSFDGWLRLVEYDN